MNDRKAQPGSDDFAGIGRCGAAVVLIVAALTRPWQALRDLLAAARHLAARAGRLALTPFGLLAAIVVSRRMDRRPTFEEHLHGRSDEES